MKKIDVTQKIYEYNGSPLLSQVTFVCPHCGQKSDEEEEVTLRVVLMRALNHIEPREDVSPEERVKRGCLSFDIYRHDQIELESEQIVLLKKLAGRAYTPLVVFQVHEILENDVNPITSAED